METAAQLERWKTNCMFSTVPTALGKLGKRPPSFPQFPQPLLLDIVYDEKKKNDCPTAQPESSRQDADESVKTTSPGHAPLAGFEVIIYGRFSGAHRGRVTRTVCSNRAAL